MLWWAVEAKALTDTERLLRVLRQPRGLGRPGSARDRPAARPALRRGRDARGVRRVRAAAGDRAGDLPGRGPGRARPRPGRAGRSRRAAWVWPDCSASVAMPESRAAPAPARRFEPLTRSLADAISAAWRAAPADVLRLRLALAPAWPMRPPPCSREAAAPSTAPARRRVLLGLLAELGRRGGVPVALAIARGRPRRLEVQSAALDVLARHGDDHADGRGSSISTRRPRPPCGRGCATSCSAGRRPPAPSSSGWTTGEIDAAEVPVDQLRQVALHGDPRLDALVRKHWGSIQAGTAEEKLAEMRRLNNDLRAGPGDRDARQGAVRQALRDLPQAIRRGGRGRPRPDRQWPATTPPRCWRTSSIPARSSAPLPAVRSR